MSITKLLYGDCMKWLPKLPEGQTSLVLADLPNMMEAEYDKNIIPLPELWQEYKRILKPGGIVALFASQPFTTKLINSNPTWLKNCWYWEKVQPMRRIEEILIFQDPNAVHKAIRYQNKIDNFIYAANQSKETANSKRVHQSQKPVALLEYIIKTYTKPGELIVDNTMGSGSTGVAAINTGRGFIGIELDGGYYNAAVKRIKEAKQQKQQEAAKGSTDEKPAAKSVTESDTPQKKITLGSLFDGLGGWQLAAIHNGVKPVWSSEIEAFPMAITKKHFPDTLQLGDITKLDGATLPPVDIICAGSPCQDLSTAGKRKGLEGERSGLFRKAIDIVYGMREATGGQYPKFFIWENVPGAFSSNKGADFQAVLEEISKSKIPMPAGGKWATAGMVRSGRCDIAWRVLDAQYWGVPQRRKRIFLIADFREKQSRNTAVLFEPESVPGNPAPGGNEGQGTAAGAENDIRATSILTASFYPNNSEKARGIGYQEETSATIRAEAQTGVLTYDVRFTSEGTSNARGHIYETDTARTLDTSTPNPDSNHGSVAVIEKPQTYSFDSLASNSMKSSNPHSGCRAVDVAKTLDTPDQNPAKNQGGIAVLEKKEVYSIAGNTIDRQIQNGGNGKGVLKDKSYTLNTIDRHAVTEPICIGNGQICQLYPQEKVGALNCMHEQQAIITAKEHKA